MDFISLINRYKNYILNIIIIGLVLIIAMNIHKNQTKNIALLRETKKLEIRKNAVLGDIAQSEEKIRVFKDAVNKKDISSTMNTVSNIAKDLSIKIISFKPQSERNYTFYVKYPFDLSISAPDYHSIGKFISKLENHPDIYTVDRISIRPLLARGEGAPTHKLIADLTINTILVKD